jgi:hypothetical protein
MIIELCGSQAQCPEPAAFTSAPASGTATLLNAHENPSERRPPARRSLKHSFKEEQSIAGWMRQRLRVRGAFAGGS